MFERLRDNITGEPYIYDPARSRCFRRTVTALAWSYGQENGSVITLGEFSEPSNQMGARRHVHVIRERRLFESEELLLAASRMQREFLANVVVTPYDDDRFVMLEEYNDRQRRARMPILRADNPITWKGSKGEGMIPYYAELVGRRLGSEKSLFFGKDCSGSMEMERLTPEDAHRKAIEMPAVCALCWALEYIDLQPIPEWGEAARSRNQNADLTGGY